MLPSVSVNDKVLYIFVSGRIGNWVRLAYLLSSFDYDVMVEMAAAFEIQSWFC